MSYVTQPLPATYPATAKEEGFMSYLSHKLSAAMWARVLLLWMTLGIAALVIGSFAVGMGVLWVSPMGPLKISVALPMREQPTDRKQFFQFTFGGAF